jgi:hypothetical protein
MEVSFPLVSGDFRAMVPVPLGCLAGIDPRIGNFLVRSSFRMRRADSVAWCSLADQNKPSL